MVIIKRKIQSPRKEFFNIVRIFTYFEKKISSLSHLLHDVKPSLCYDVKRSLKKIKDCQSKGFTF